jgi:signal peptidase II
MAMGQWAAELTAIGRTAALLMLVVMTISCDRMTKHLAVTMLAGEPARVWLAGSVRLEYAENTGGFLSLGADLPPATRTGLFTIGTGLLLVAVIAVGIRQRWSGWLLVGASLMVTGGLSNLADRIVRGSVIDFMNVGLGPLRTGIFNVADVAVLIGGGIVLLRELRPGRPGSPPDDGVDATSAHLPADEPR